MKIIYVNSASKLKRRSPWTTKKVMSDLPREFEASRQGPDKPLHDVTADTPSRHRHASRGGERTDGVQDSFVEVTDSEAVITDSFFVLANQKTRRSDWPYVTAGRFLRLEVVIEIWQVCVTSSWSMFSSIVFRLWACTRHTSHTWEKEHTHLLSF